MSFDESVIDDDLYKALGEVEDEETMNNAREQGIEQKAIEVAKKMLKKKYTLNDIKSITGLSIKTIKNL